MYTVKKKNVYFQEIQCFLEHGEEQIYQHLVEKNNAINHRKKLLKLPDETIIYPGHGKPTKIGDEKRIYLELKPKQ